MEDIRERWEDQMSGGGPSSESWEEEGELVPGEEPGSGDPDRRTRGGESCRAREEAWREGRETNDAARGRRRRRRRTIVGAGVLVGVRGEVGRIFFCEEVGGDMVYSSIRYLILWAAQVII